MGMRAIDLGLGRKSLLANPKGNELLYHLRLVEGGKDTLVNNIEFQEIVDTDDVKIYHKGALLTTTSTNELSTLILVANFNTMTLTEVQTPEGMFYASIHQDILKREYVGVLTDGQGRPVAFVIHINGTLWADDGKRLFQLEDTLPKELKYLNSQDAIRFLSKRSDTLEGKEYKIVFFD